MRNQRNGSQVRKSHPKAIEKAMLAAAGSVELTMIVDILQKQTKKIKELNK
jgi:hypothetical protein